MESLSTVISLKPNFNLLNSNFDGYKLKVDQNQIVYTRQIENGIFQNAGPEAANYLFTRMESLHNHLFSDPFEDLAVYLFNKKGHLLMFSFVEGYVPAPVVIWQEDLEVSDGKNNINQRFSPSVSFPSSSISVTSNGCGILNILQTGDRTTGASWVNLKEVKIPSGSIVSSLLVEQPTSGKAVQELHVLVLSVISAEDLRKDALYSNSNKIFDGTTSTLSTLHIIYWLTFWFDGSNWSGFRDRRIAGSKSLEYVSLDYDGSGVVLLSHDKYHFIYDSDIPVQGPNEKNKSSEVKDSSQNNETNALEVSDASKDEEGDSKEGNSSDEVDPVQQILSNMPSGWSSNPDFEKPAFDPGQLEACDDAAEDLLLSVLDGTSHGVSHLAHLGAVHHLFNAQTEGEANPSFCLRHDVDGVLWRLGSGRSFHHVATFHAFGYVKASKTMAKYTQAATDHSYVAVADVSSHVYVFCQPSAFGGELRNRKSGRASTTIARQFILSLKNHDQVMGFHAARTCLFILTATDLFVYLLETS